MESTKDGDQRNGDQLKEKYKNLNPNLQQIKEDTLYHIGLIAGKQDLKTMFGDVKVIVKIAQYRQLNNFRPLRFRVVSDILI